MEMEMAFEKKLAIWIWRQLRWRGRGLGGRFSNGGGQRRWTLLTGDPLAHFNRITAELDAENTIGWHKKKRQSRSSRRASFNHHFSSNWGKFLAFYLAAKASR